MPPSLPLSLPIDPFLPEVTRSLAANPNLVLVAEPGAGKTTRVPPAIIHAGLLSDPHPALVMLQPRRVAARAAAERIAEEQHWTCGQEVGYHVRFERRITSTTRIRVLTEAILSRQLLSDPELSGIGAVLLDEFHERSIHSDLALALLREVQLSFRPDLKILVMSATLDAEPVAAFLGGAPILRVPGRVFPVDTQYQTPRPGTLPEQVATAVDSVLHHPGHILCFLPGAEEIRRTQRLLSNLSADADILPLHGTLPFEDQRRAVAPSPNRRKIILATNIAETSLTIDGVRVVVDSGLSRQTAFDPRRGLESLRLGKISKASAAQRAGRAGRTADGICLRLWSAKQHNELPDFDPPELRRIDLAPTLLTLLTWGVSDLTNFAWFEPPTPEATAQAIRLLQMLGAAQGKDHSLTATPLGQRMANLPLHPRLARLLIDAVDSNRAEEGATLAALLSERDLRLRDRTATFRDRRPTEISSSDLLPRLELLDYATKRNFHPSLEDDGIEPAAARQVARTKQELLSRLPPPSKTKRSDIPQDLLLSAYPDRVCLRRSSDPSAGLMVGNWGGHGGTGGGNGGGIGILLAPESSVRQGNFFLALDVREDDRSTARQATVSLAHAVELADLHHTFPHAFSRRTTCVYDPAKDKVVGRVQTLYYNLVLEESDDARVDDSAAASALADALLPQLDQLIASDESAANLFARIRLAAQHLKSDTPWPSPPWNRFREHLTHHLTGARRLSDFRPAAFLQSLLVWPLDRLLDEHVPTHFTVPTGNRIRIDYTPPPPTPPILPVRLQEMFGATTTPTICQGKVPLLLHLLSPGYKPVQITQDLVSFWKNTYEQVRKDLRARYPKHSWPDNPLTAPPVAKGRSSK